MRTNVFLSILIFMLNNMKRMKQSRNYLLVIKINDREVRNLCLIDRLINIQSYDYNRIFQSTRCIIALTSPSSIHN